MDDYEGRERRAGNGRRSEDEEDRVRVDAIADKVLRRVTTAFTIRAGATAAVLFAPLIAGVWFMAERVSSVAEQASQAIADVQDQGEAIRTNQQAIQLMLQREVGDTLRLHNLERRVGEIEQRVPFR